MANISYNCELLRQPSAEKTLTGCLDFRAVYDKASRPVIFSIDRDGRLLLLAQDEKGDACLVDLSKQLGVQSLHRVSALAVCQAKNLDIYLAFASGDGTSPSKLWILPPSQPLGRDWFRGIVADSVFQGPQASNFLINRLLLASSEDRDDYPFLAAVVNISGTKKMDVRRIDVNTSSKVWKWENDLQYPFNITDMVDYCVGRTPAASGIFGLDNTQGIPTLTFAGVSGKGPGPRAAYQVNLPVVANPKAIATTLDEDGLTNVLVCGDGILHIASQDCADSALRAGTVQPATLMHESLRGIHKVQIAQQGRSITIWVLNEKDNLVGLSAQLKVNDDECDEIGQAETPVPLLPKGDQLRTYDAVLEPQSQSQQVFCLKEDGSVTCLRQAGDSKLWSQATLKVPDPLDVQDTNVYSCQIHLEDDNNKMLSFAKVQVSASSQVTGSANGTFIALGGAETEVETDSRGIIVLEIPAPDLVAPNVTISVGTKRVSFNPANKAINKISAAAAAGKLSDFRREDGRAVFPNIDDKTNKAIVDLSKRFLENSPGSFASTSAEKSVQAQHLTLSANSVSKAGNAIWQFIHGIVSGVEVIKDFAYEAGVLIINTVEKAWKWVVETAEQALSALSALLKLGETILEDALTWLAEQLDWESITDVVTIFNDVFDTGLDIMQDLIAEGGDWIDGYFEEVEARVGSWHLPPEMPEKLASLKPELDKKEPARNQVTDSPGFNWAMNRVQAQEMRGQSTENPGSTETTEFSDVLKAIWDEIVEPLWENLKGTLSHVWEDFKKLFDKDDPMTWQDIFKNIGVDLLIGIIRAVRKLVHGMLAVSSKLFSWIKSILHQKIDIWVVSKVYRKVSGGRDLTIMDLCGLLLAVPTTWFFKYVCGTKPCQVPEIAQLLSDIKRRQERNMQTQRPSNSMMRADFVNTQKVSHHAVTVPQPSEAQEALLLTHFDELKTQKSAVSTHDAGISDEIFENRANKAELSADWESKSGWAKFIAWVKYFWRLGFMLKTVGVVVYNGIDAVATIQAWQALGAEVPFERGSGWKKGFSVYLAVVTTVCSVPVDKLNRPGDAITCRFMIWSITGAINIYKAGLPAPLKPPLAAWAGSLDLIFYTKILKEEGFIDATDKTDTVLEMTSRILADVWAVGSWWNGSTGGKEPYSFWGTVAVGAVVNIESMVLANQHWNYFKENAWKDEFNPPSLQNTLNGSLL